MKTLHACLGHGHERSVGDSESASWLGSSCSPSDQISYATFGSNDETPDARLTTIAAHDKEVKANEKTVEDTEENGDVVLELVNKAIRMLTLWIRRLFPPFCRAGRPMSGKYDDTESEATTDRQADKVWTDGTGKWNTCGVHRDEDNQSATTEATDLLSESGSFYENPASEVDDDEEIAKSKAARLLRVASSCPQERLLCVDKYLCKCGKCAKYEIIAQDVAKVITWRDPEELRSVTRLLQAFSTYNEAIGYRPDMIGTADDCLSVWCGDEDQAFTSFVVLQDVVPFLCANTV